MKKPNLFIYNTNRENRMRAIYQVKGIEYSDFSSVLAVGKTEDSDKDSVLGVYQTKYNDKNAQLETTIKTDDSNIDVVISTYSAPKNSDKFFSIRVREDYFNKMNSIYEVEQPVRQTAVMYPTIDSYVRSKQGYNRINYGNEKSMLVGNEQNGSMISYVRFGLAGWNPFYRILDVKFKLYYSNFTTELIEFQLNELERSWGEYSITFENKPKNTKLISDSYKLNTQEKCIEFDFTEIVKYWTKNPQMNNGFSINFMNEIERVFGFYTRESIKPPELVIDYYDNRIYSTGRSNTRSELFVYNLGEYDKESEINVNYMIGYSDKDSELYVHRREVPVPNDKDSELLIIKTNLESELSSRQIEESDKDSTIIVRQSDVSDLDSEILISKLITDSEMFVGFKSNKESQINVYDYNSEEKDSQIASSRKITYAQLKLGIVNSDKESVIKAVYSGESEHLSELAISREETNAELVVQQQADNDKESELRVYDRFDLESIIDIISNNNKDAEIEIVSTSQFESRLLVSKITSDAILGVYFKKSSEVESILQVSELFVNDQDTVLIVRIEQGAYAFIV